jgi:hypothetical protein
MLGLGRGGPPVIAGMNVVSLLSSRSSGASYAASSMLTGTGSDFVTAPFVAGPERLQSVALSR